MQNTTNPAVTAKPRRKYRDPENMVTSFSMPRKLLEEAKLQRMPKPKSLAGRIAVVTGGAGGIGAATAERLQTRLSSRISQPFLGSRHQSVAAETAYFRWGGGGGGGGSCVRVESRGILPICLWRNKHFTLLQN